MKFFSKTFNDGNACPSTETAWSRFPLLSVYALIDAARSIWKSSYKKHLNPYQIRHVVES